MTSGGGQLRLRSLRKAYDSVVAVSDVSLEIGTGEFITLLGPSGSGKTTTLMMIGGFDTPDSGSIVLDGTDITYVPAHRRAIGVVFQNYALFPHMNVFDNVAFPLKMRDLPRTEIRTKVNEALELVQLASLGERSTRQLSGGQQQRVALARALVFRPALLLLDEPLGALDRMLREHMQLELRRIHRTLGTTMIYVTHDQDEALVLSDRIVVMNKGRIEQMGTPEEIYESPASRFVAEFVGETNLLHARVGERHDEHSELALGRKTLNVPLPPELRNADSIGVIVRPERIAIGRPVPSADLGIEGTIEDRIYLGDQIKYVVRCDGNIAIIVKEPRRFGAANVSRGDRVALSWNASDCRFVALDQDGGREASPPGVVTA